MTPAPDRSESDRERLYRMLYRSWPAWSDIRSLIFGDGTSASSAAHSLWNAGRVEAGHREGFYRVNMGAVE